MKVCTSKTSSVDVRQHLRTYGLFPIIQWGSEARLFLSRRKRKAARWSRGNEGQMTTDLSENKSDAEMENQWTKNKKKLHAVTKGFSNSKKPEEKLEIERRKNRKERTGVAGKKSYRYCHTSPCKLFLLSFSFKLWLSFSISIELGHQQSSRNFTVEKELTACWESHDRWKKWEWTKGGVEKSAR